MYVENCPQPLKVLKQELIIEEPYENRLTTEVQLEGRAHFYMLHIFCTLNLKIDFEKGCAICNSCLKMYIQSILLRTLT